MRQLAGVEFSHEWLVMALFAAQGFSRGRVVGSTAMSWGMAIWTVSSVALIVILSTSWRQPGLWAATLGIGLNLLVVLLNAGMPVVLNSASDASATLATIATTAGFYRLASRATVAKSLADSLVLNIGGGRYFASVGDLLLVVGIAVFIAAVMIRSDLVDNSRQ